MAYNASADLWYQYFKQSDGPQWWILFGFYGTRALWATIGLLLNVSLVYVTWRHKSLHGICNILLATESFLSILQDASFYVSFASVLSGVPFMPYQYCFWVLIPLCMCGQAAQMTMVLTGFDRLLAVLLPVWYKKRNKSHALALAYFVLLCDGVYSFLVYYIDWLGTTKELMVICSTETMAQGGMGPVLKTVGLSLSGTMMGTYVLVWLVVFHLKADSQAIATINRSLIKSLLVLICVNLVGVFFRLGIQLAFSYLPSLSVFVRTGTSVSLSLLTIAVYSANAPVLYFTSKEYRCRFNAHFPILAKLFPTSQQNKVAAGAVVQAIYRSVHCTYFYFCLGPSSQSNRVLLSIVREMAISVRSI